MPVLSVALLQMVSLGHDKEAAILKGDEYCRRAQAMGADIALFPEMWNTGYMFFDPKREGAREEWEALAISREDGYFVHFRDLAAELGIAIAITYLERWDGLPRNTVSIIDRHGDVRLNYAKVHTCDFDAEILMTPGEDFPVCELDTAGGSVKVGAMICYDREFPETARILMLGGAEVILVPNACNLEMNRLAQFRTRAYENMVGVAMTNYAPPRANGHSVAFDGVAFTDEESCRDMLVVEGGDLEGIHLARFDMERLRQYRQKEPWGNAFRRPRLYGALMDEAVREPFIRPEARR